MEFFNLNRELQKLSECNSLELEVALDAMIALIRDLRNIHHVKFAEGTVAKPSALNTKLSQLSNELIRVYDAHKGSFEQLPRDYFPADIRKIERESLEIQQRLLDQEEQLEKVEATKNQLELRRAQEQRNLSALQEQQDRIQTLTDELDRAIAQAKGIDLPALEQQKAALEQEKDSLTRRQSELRSDIQSAEADRDALAAQLSKAEAALAAVEADNRDAQQRISDVTAHVTAADTELADKKQTHQTLLNELNALKQRISGESDAIARLQSDIHTANSDLTEKNGLRTSLQAQVDGLRSQIVSIDDINGGLYTTLAALRQEAQALATSIEDAKQEVGELNRIIAEHTADHEAAKQQTDSLSAQNAGLEKALAEIRARINALTRERDAKQLDLSAAAAEETLLAGQAADALAKKQELDHKISTHQQILAELAGVDADISAADDALAQARAGLQTASNNLADTSAEVVSVRHNICTLESEIAQQEQQLRDAEDTRLARQNERDGLIASLAQSQTETQTLQAHANELTAQVERTNAAAEELRCSITRLDADIEAAKDAREALAAEVCALESELDYQNARNEEYRQDTLKTAADALAAAKLTYDGLVARRGDLESQLKAAADDRKKIDREIDTISIRLRKNKDELAESSSVLAEKEAELQSRQDELDTLKAKISRNADDLKDVLNEIDEASATLENWDPVGTKVKYERKKAELMERLAAVQAMQSDLEKKTAELEALRAETREQNQRQTAIQEEYRLLSDEFSKLRDPRTQEQIDHYRAGISVMQEVRRRIRDSSRYLPGAPDLPDDVSAALQANLDYAGEQLNTVRSGVSKYIDTYTRHTAQAES